MSSLVNVLKSQGGERVGIGSYVSRMTGHRLWRACHAACIPMWTVAPLVAAAAVLLASPESSSCSADGCTTTVVSPTSAAVAGTVTYSFNCSAQHTVPVVAALTAEAPCNVCRMSVAPSVTVSLAALPTTAAVRVTKLRRSIRGPC